MDEINFTYCPRCGKSLTAHPPKSLTCDSCNLELYLNPRPCNAAIIENDKGEILLVERAREPQKGLWDLPGGFVDLGETIEESVRREVKEELGVEVAEMSYFTSTIDRYLYSGINYYTLCTTFRVKVRGELRPADDVASHRYFALRDVPYEDVAFESIKAILKKVYSSSSTRLALP